MTIQVTKLIKKTHDKYGTKKLPKQWLRWAEKAGLVVMDNWGKKKRGWYLKGRGRNWRVDCNGIFECSCPLERFDRWANSRGAESDKFPTNEREFLKIVKELVEASVDAE